MTGPTMTDPDQDKLINDFARDLLVKVAPEELPLLPASSDFYFKHGESELRKKEKADRMLGMGLESGDLYLAPVVLVVATEVIKFLASILKDASKPLVTDLIRKILGKIFANEPKSTELLSNDHRERVRQLVVEKARSFNIPEQVVQQLANAVKESISARPGAT